MSGKASGSSVAPSSIKFALTARFANGLAILRASDHVLIIQRSSQSQDWGLQGNSPVLTEIGGQRLAIPMQVVSLLEDAACLSLSLTVTNVLPLSLDKLFVVTSSSRAASDTTKRMMRSSSSSSVSPASFSTAASSATPLHKSIGHSVSTKCLKLSRDSVECPWGLRIRHEPATNSFLLSSVTGYHVEGRCEITAINGLKPSTLASLKTACVAVVTLTGNFTLQPLKEREEASEPPANASSESMRGGLARRCAGGVVGVELLDQAASHLKLKFTRASLTREWPIELLTSPNKVNTDSTPAVAVRTDAVDILPRSFSWAAVGKTAKNNQKGKGNLVHLRAARIGTNLSKFPSSAATLRAMQKVIKLPSRTLFIRCLKP